MTVILVLFTFAAFLVIDHFRGKRHAARLSVPAIPAGTEIAAPRLRPHVVAGFQVPDNVRYHPGHTWALKESPNLVRIGMDDFACKLLGNFEKIAFPRRGQWIRQGQPIFSIERHGTTVDLVSPIEGTVSGINEVLIKDPALAARDPYGDGWLATVQAPDAAINFRNLLGGGLARSWMEEAGRRLQRHLPQMAGALAQDGGLAGSDDTRGPVP